jgi:hypothetical protein
MFTRVGVVTIPRSACSILWPNLGSKRHASERYMLFKAQGQPREGATLWVKLPPESDRCYDCRLVHFMITIA